MPKRYNIRWQQSDDEELRKAVKNFNAKIDRLAKKDPKSKSALPEKVTVRQMKELVSTRQDLKREIASLRRFSKRGAETLVEVPDSYYNLKVTKWQKEDMNRRAATINRKRNARRQEIADIEMTDRGKKLGYTRGQLGMGKADEVALEPIKVFTPKMTYTDLRKKMNVIRNESQSTYWNRREMMMMSNYIKSLRENFSEKDPDVKAIIGAIEKMDFKQFYKIWQAEGGNFEMSYPGDTEEERKYITALKATWVPSKKPQTKGKK